MAWLSGLAGKAENLLNKIDQNTAAVLNKDKTEVDTRLTEVKWMTPENSATEIIPDKSQITVDNAGYIPEVVSIPEVPQINSVPPLGKIMQNNFVETVSVPIVPLTATLENTNHVDTDSEMSVQSDHSSPSSHQSIDVSMLNKNTNASWEESNVDPSDFNTMPYASIERLLAAQREFKHRLGRDEFSSLKNTNLETKNDALYRQLTDYQKEINVLKEMLQNLAAEKKHFLREIEDLKSSLERSKLELDMTKSDLEQHRVRATKILQEKEKLIADLRNSSNSGFDDSTITEISQLKQEKECFREENQQLLQQLKSVRQELLFADTKLEKIKNQTEEAQAQAQEMINMERRRRLDAEEDAKNHSDEIRSLKEELSTLRKNFSAKTVRQESEISRLKSQLSAMSTPSSEIELRLSTLTQTLVLKQQAVESLTTERNALRLQLEKIEHEYRMLGNTHRNGSYNSVNDTDDVKAQVPTFLVETPFDTGVTRRVKRAYSTLDAISIRTGVFLRRYPLARILVFIYMGLLQLWVLIVLLVKSPEAH